MNGKESYNLVTNEKLRMRLSNIKYHYFCMREFLMIFFH